MKKLLQLALVGATIAVTAFAVGSQPTSATCSDDSCCSSACDLK